MTHDRVDSDLLSLRLPWPVPVPRGSKVTVTAQGQQRRYLVVRSGESGEGHLQLDVVEWPNAKVLDEGLVVSPLLFQRLREWRLAKARERDVPAYVVATNAALAGIAAAAPKSLAELAKVVGIGPQFITSYGRELVGWIAEGAPADEPDAGTPSKGTEWPVEDSMSPAESLLAAMGRDWPSDVPPPDELVWAEVDGLPPRTAKIVSWRHGRWGPPQSLEQIGNEIGVTRERIRQILVKAYRRLGHPSRWKRMWRLADLQPRPRQTTEVPSPAPSDQRVDDRPDLRFITASLVTELVEAAGGRFSAARIAWILVGSEGPMTRRFVTEHQIVPYGALRHLDFKKVREHVVKVAEGSPRLIVQGASQEITVLGMWPSRSDGPLLKARPILDLALPARAHNALLRANIRTIGALVGKTDDELVRLRNFGRSSLADVRARLGELGLLAPSDQDLRPRGGTRHAPPSPEAALDGDLLLEILAAVGGPVSASRIAWVLVGSHELLTANFIKRYDPPGVGLLRGLEHGDVRDAVLDCGRRLPGVTIRDGVLSVDGRQGAGPSPPAAEPPRQETEDMQAP